MLEINLKPISLTDLKNSSLKSIDTNCVSYPHRLIKTLTIIHKGTDNVIKTEEPNILS